MSSYFDKIKKSLASSTTLPMGSAGSTSVLMGSTHVHNADGSCCGHHHHHHHDDEDDTTNPKGGCC